MFLESKSIVHNCDRGVRMRTFMVRARKLGRVFILLSHHINKRKIMVENDIDTIILDAAFFACNTNYNSRTVRLRVIFKAVVMVSMSV
jgi:hypothetical protein